MKSKPKARRHRLKGLTAVSLVSLVALAGLALVANGYVFGTGADSAGSAGSCCSLDPDQLQAQLKRGDAEKAFCLTQEMFVASATSQGDFLEGTCPTYGPPDDPMVRDAAIPNGSTPIRVFKVLVTVFRERRGANPAATGSEVIAAMYRINSNLTPHRIQLDWDWRYVDDSKYRYLDPAEVGQMKTKYAVSPESQLNIYVTTYNPGGSWGTFPWDNNAVTPYGGAVIHQPHFADPSNVPTHEVGHCLGLWHTFHGVSEVDPCSDCYEPAGRPEGVGDMTGDYCSDTNPLPRTFDCFDPPGLDPCSGNAWTNTPWQNFMGYSLNCAIEFTPQQAGRMHAWSDHVLSGWIAPPPAPNAPGAPGLSSNGGVVTITWADNSDNETGFEVERERNTRGKKWGERTTVATVGANVTSAQDSPGSDKFRYRVRAFNGNGSSDWSDWTEIEL